MTASGGFSAGSFAGRAATASSDGGAADGGGGSDGGVDADSSGDAADPARDGADREPVRSGAATASADGRTGAPGARLAAPRTAFTMCSGTVGCPETTATAPIIETTTSVQSPRRASVARTRAGEPGRGDGSGTFS